MHTHPRRKPRGRGGFGYSVTECWVWLPSVMCSAFCVPLSTTGVGISSRTHSRAKFMEHGLCPLAAVALRPTVMLGWEVVGAPWPSQLDPWRPSLALCNLIFLWILLLSLFLCRGLQNLRFLYVGLIMTSWRAWFLWNFLQVWTFPIQTCVCVPLVGTLWCRELYWSVNWDAISASVFSGCRRWTFDWLGP